MKSSLDERLRPNTVEEVANHLRKSKDAVYRLIRDGRLDAVKVGSTYRVTAEALDRYLGR